MDQAALTGATFYGSTITLFFNAEVQNNDISPTQWTVTVNGTDYTPSVVEKDGRAGALASGTSVLITLPITFGPTDQVSVSYEPGQTPPNTFLSQEAFRYSRLMMSGRPTYPITPGMAQERGLLSTSKPESLAT